MRHFIERLRERLRTFLRAAQARAMLAVGRLHELILAVATIVVKAGTAVAKFSSRLASATQLAGAKVARFFPRFVASISLFTAATVSVLLGATLWLLVIVPLLGVLAGFKSLSNVSAFGHLLIAGKITAAHWQDLMGPKFMEQDIETTAHALIMIGEGVQVLTTMAVSAYFYRRFARHQLFARLIVRWPRFLVKRAAMVLRSG